MEKRLAKIYYSPQGYWMELATVKRLTQAAKVSEPAAKQWLQRQALWQVFLPAPRHILRPKFDVPTPNAVHQADLLFMPHDKVGRKTFEYALTVVDVASRFKAAEPLATKNSDEVAQAFQRIYRRGPLHWPKLLQVDPGREFMGAVSREMEKHGTNIRRGHVEVHLDLAIVERFNRTLAVRLFRQQYAVEMRLPEGERAVAWVARLPRVFAALNNQTTRLTGLKPADAIQKQPVFARLATWYSRPFGMVEKTLPAGTEVRYLYQPGELEGGTRRATDPIWSLKVFEVARALVKHNQPVMYWLADPDIGGVYGPKRSFVREELMVVPPNTELSPVKPG